MLLLSSCNQARAPDNARQFTTRLLTCDAGRGEEEWVTRGNIWELSLRYGNYTALLLLVDGFLLLDARCGKRGKRKKNLQEEDHPSVGHGVRQSQDAAAHDGVAQVEDRHAERGLALELGEVRQWPMCRRILVWHEIMSGVFWMICQFHHIDLKNSGMTVF